MEAERADLGRPERCGVVLGEAVGAARVKGGKGGASESRRQMRYPKLRHPHAQSRQSRLSTLKTVTISRYYSENHCTQTTSVRSLCDNYVKPPTDVFSVDRGYLYVATYSTCVPSEECDELFAGSQALEPIAAAPLVEVLPTR